MFWPPQRSLSTHCHKLNKVKAWERTCGIGQHLSCYKQRGSCLFYLITREFGKSYPVQKHGVLGEMPCAEGVLQPAVTWKLRVLLTALCLSWTVLLFGILTLQSTVLRDSGETEAVKKAEGQQRVCDWGSEGASTNCLQLSVIIVLTFISQGDTGMLLRIMSFRQKDAFY